MCLPFVKENTSLQGPDQGEVLQQQEATTEVGKTGFAYTALSATGSTTNGSSCLHWKTATCLTIMCLPTVKENTSLQGPDRVEVRQQQEATTEDGKTRFAFTALSERVLQQMDQAVCI